MKEMIVKIQVPLYSSGPQDALIYDKTREHQWFLPVAKIKGLMGGKPKKFFHAEVDNSGAVHFGNEAEWQDW